MGKSVGGSNYFSGISLKPSGQMLETALFFSPETVRMVATLIKPSGPGWIATIRPTGHLEPPFSSRNNTNCPTSWLFLIR